MGEYRRFVAYVYEYRKGKKENNCGFVKVEARGEKCTMEIHLQCEGIPSRGECKVYGFVRSGKRMKGILLGSCETETNGVRCSLETSAKEMGGVPVPLEEIGGMVFVTDLGGFFGTEWDDIEIVPEFFENFSEEGTEKEPEEEETKEKEAKKEAEKEEEVVVAEVPQEALTENAQEDEAQEKNIQEEKEPRPPKRPMPGETYMPFEDDEFTECRKIKPGDLSCFSRKNCPLRQNRFLLYGYYNFGHLLLCTKENGQQILGVPGVYDQQERFMANMFGFPFFRKSREIQAPEGRGGYWYRLINSPDLH